MKITKRNDIYVAETAFEERHLPKAAGFFWHGGECRKGCKACAAGAGRVWWTAEITRAQRLAQYADDTCRTELTAVAEKKEQVLAASAAVDARVTVPAPAGCVYRGFQKAGIAFGLGTRNVLIADEMGLGKTIQALGILNGLPVDESRNVLAIVPASLRVNWKNEATKWLVRPYNIHLMTSAEIPADANFVVVNYDRLAGVNGKSIVAALKARSWDVLIADEAHRLKNVESQRSKAVLGSRVKISKKGEKPVRYEVTPGIAAQAKRLVFLTGTPIVNRPKELWPLLAALDPDQFGDFMRFAFRYCNATKKTIYVKGGRGMTQTVWDFNGASNELELQEKLRSSIMVRRLKSEVEKELPPKTWQVIRLANDEVRDLIEEEDRRTGPTFSSQNPWMNALARAEEALETGDQNSFETAMQDIEAAFKVDFEEVSEVRHRLAKAKVKFAIEHIEDVLEETDKVIVFAHHGAESDDPIQAIAAHFGEAAVVVNGAVAPDKRQALVDRFQNDPTVRVFIGGIRSAGEGITLTAASTVIFVELDWVPSAMMQASDRAHRIGQHRNVLCQMLAFEGSLDARMAQLLAEKARKADLILDRAFTTDAERVSAAAELVREEEARKAMQTAHEKGPEKALGGFCAICGTTRDLVHNDGMSDFCAAHAA